MRILRSTIYWLVLLAVILAAGSKVYTTYESNKPCAEPVLYSIGEVDSRFSVSNDTLLEKALDAATIWNDAAGKPVLAYDSNAELKINLIYDEREATALLGEEIASIQAEQSVTRAALERDQDALLSKQAAYNNKVESINARGGATRAEAAELEKERAALTRQTNLISARTDAYNAELAELNILVEEFNQTAGRTYEEGNYIRDDQGERINIYVAINQDQLTRVLAHEFGHAIGLGHNDNPSAIMYAKNESGSLTPTEADVNELINLCGLKQ